MTKLEDSFMKVVLDTNVYISAIIIGGICEKVLEEIRKRDIKILISPDIVNEISKVLKEKFLWNDLMIGTAIYDILQRAILITPTSKVSVIKEKKEDNLILECALEGEAHFIISGDKKHILPLKQFRKIKIISPKDFLKMLIS